MTLISSIIADAFRESNLTAIGASPTSAEQTEALRVLNRFISSLFGGKVGQELKTINYGTNNVTTTDQVFDHKPFIDDTHVPANKRLMLNLAAATTLYLNPNPQAGERFGIVDMSGNLATRNVILNGNGRKIETTTTVTLSTNSLAREWFFRDDIGDWKRLADLITSDESPFPSEFDDVLIIGLAMRLVGRTGPALAEESIVRYREQVNKFRSRYSQVHKTPVDQGLVRLSGQKPSYYTDRMSDNSRFNTGW